MDINKNVAAYMLLEVQEGEILNKSFPRPWYRHFKCFPLIIGGQTQLVTWEIIAYYVTTIAGQLVSTQAKDIDHISKRGNNLT